jgi:hypothetical protein
MKTVVYIIKYPKIIKTIVGYEVNTDNVLEDIIWWEGEWIRKPLWHLIEKDAIDQIQKMGMVDE